MNAHTSLRLILQGALGALLFAQGAAQTPTAPVIAIQPLSQSVAAGASVTFSVVATGTPAPRYQWFKNGSDDIENARSATFTINSARPRDAAVYTVRVSNLAGSVTSAPATLTVAGTAPTPVTPGIAPTITTPPASLVVAAGAPVTFTVVATGTPAPRYRWLKNGHEIDNGNAYGPEIDNENAYGQEIDSGGSATLTIAAAQLQDAAVYTVRVSNGAGSVTSAPASLAVSAVAGTIATAPLSLTVPAGAPATFAVTTAGTGLTYQWAFNGSAIAGATAATFTAAGTALDGVYTVTVLNSAGVPAAAAAAALNLTFDTRLTSVSTRGHVGALNEVLLTGFVVRGGTPATATDRKQVLLRAIGPTLGTQFGVAGALAAPTLTLSTASRVATVLGANSGWGGTPALATAFAQSGAFPLPATSADAALLATLGNGAYLAQVTAPGPTGGVALAELYDADSGSPAAKIVSVATRAVVGATVSDTLSVGFTVSGTTADTVVVRGFGLNLGTALASQVTVFNAAGNPVAAVTAWGSATLSSLPDNDNVNGLPDNDHVSGVPDNVQENNLGGFDRGDGERGGGDGEHGGGDGERGGGLRAPRGANYSAQLLSLAPGAYTAHVTGASGATGIGQLEIYEVR